MIKKVFNYIKDNKLKIIIFTDKINIVNYKEILSFDDKIISVLCDHLIVEIKGETLTINFLYDNEVLILGTITNISFRRIND